MSKSVVFYTDNERAAIARGVISAFGGVAPLSNLLQHRSKTTVQSWWDRGNIPTARQQDLFLLARSAGVDLPAEAFFYPPAQTQVDE